MLANKKKMFENPRDPAESRARSRMDQDAGISEKNFAREALTVNPAKACQPLGAVFAAVGFESTHSLRARLAGLRRLLPQPPLAPLQGAELLRLLVDDRGRGGVRRPQQHDRRPGQHLQHVQAEDDRGLDDLHGGSDRRRPQRLHQDREGEGLGAGRIRRAVRAHAGLRRQPRHRLRQCAEGHLRALLGRQGRHGAQARARSPTTRSTSSAASTATRSATCARSSASST